MKKLLTVFVGVFLTMPLAALDANAPASVDINASLRAGGNVTGSCWFWTGYKWVYIC